MLFKDISIRWVTENKMELSLTNDEKRTIELTEESACVWKGNIKNEKRSRVLVIGCKNRKAISTT